ncbi:MAG: DDE-type integrase/transposase/recombinase [Candidatus Thermoplasmatota archaeon]
MLTRIASWIISNKIFQRKRTNPGSIALAVLVYHFGLSYRNAQEILKAFEPRSHEAIRKWYHRLSALFPRVQRKKRRAIAIDETKLKVRDKWFYVWAAIDIDSWKVLGVYISETRSCLDSIRFLRMILKYCEGRPFVYVDGGPW